MTKNLPHHLEFLAATLGLLPLLLVVVIVSVFLAPILCILGVLDGLLSIFRTYRNLCDGGEASTTPPPATERAPLLKDAPLPGVFEAWIREHLR